LNASRLLILALSDSISKLKLVEMTVVYFLIGVRQYDFFHQCDSRLYSYWELRTSSFDFI